MASPVQATTQPGGAVKIEPYDGHYDCFSCLESVRPDLKEAKACGNDGNGAVLKCRKLAVQHWSPWTQAGPVGGAIAVPDDGPDADPDKREGSQSVPVRGGKAAVGGKRTAEKKVTFLPFSDALLCARSLHLKNSREWCVW